MTTMLNDTQVLGLLKAVRNRVNEIPSNSGRHDQGRWTHEVIYHLDRAADAIEYPKSPGDILDMLVDYAGLCAFLERASRRIEEAPERLPFPADIGQHVLAWLKGGAQGEPKALPDGWAMPLPGG